MPNLDEQSMGGNREKNEGRKPSTPGSHVSEPPGALIEPSRGLRFFLEAQRLSG